MSKSTTKQTAAKCFVCLNTPTKLITQRQQKIYTTLLVQCLLDETEEDDYQRDFTFCINCSRKLQRLSLLSTLPRSLSNNAKKIELCLLSSIITTRGSDNDDKYMTSFRIAACKGFIPVVRLDKDNVLFVKEKEGGSNGTPAHTSTSPAPGTSSKDLTAEDCVDDRINEIGGGSPILVESDASDTDEPGIDSFIDHLSSLTHTKVSIKDFRPKVRLGKDNGLFINDKRRQNTSLGDNVKDATSAKHIPPPPAEPTTDVCGGGYNILTRKRKLHNSGPVVSTLPVRVIPALPDVIPVLPAPVVPAPESSQTLNTVSPSTEDNNAVSRPAIVEKVICDIEVPNLRDAKPHKNNSTDRESMRFNDDKIQPELIEIEGGGGGDYSFIENVSEFQPNNQPKIVQVEQGSSEIPTTSANAKTMTSTSKTETRVRIVPARQKTADNKYSNYPRPIFNDQQLAFIALANCDTASGKIGTRQVLNFLEHYFPYFRTDNDWKMGINNILQNCKIYFTRISEQNPPYWDINRSNTNEVRSLQRNIYNSWNANFWHHGLSSLSKDLLQEAISVALNFLNEKPVNNKKERSINKGTKRKLKLHDTAYAVISDTITDNVIEAITNEATRKKKVDGSLIRENELHDIIQIDDEDEDTIMTNTNIIVTDGNTSGHIKEPSTSQSADAIASIAVNSEPENSHLISQTKTRNPVGRPRLRKKSGGTNQPSNKRKRTNSKSDDNPEYIVVDITSKNTDTCRNNAIGILSPILETDENSVNTESGLEIQNCFNTEITADNLCVETTNNSKRDQIEHTSDVESVLNILDVEIVSNNSKIEVVPVHSNVEIVAALSEVEIIPVNSTDEIIPSNCDVEVVPSNSDAEVATSNSDVEVVPSTSDVEVVPSTSDVEIVPSNSNVEIVPSTSDVEIVSNNPVFEIAQTKISEKVPENQSEIFEEPHHHTNSDKLEKEAVRNTNCDVEVDKNGDNPCSSGSPSILLGYCPKTSEDVQVSEKSLFMERLGLKCITKTLNAEQLEPTEAKQHEQMKTVTGADTDQEWPEPPLIISQLMFLAVSNPTNKSMTRNEIVQFIRDHFPYYRGSTSWQQKINHFLLTLGCFQQIGQADSQSWRIKEDWKSHLNERTGMETLISSAVESFDAIISYDKLENILLKAIGDDFDVASFKERVEKYKIDVEKNGKPDRKSKKNYSRCVSYADSSGRTYNVKI